MIDIVKNKIAFLIPLLLGINLYLCLYYSLFAEPCVLKGDEIEYVDLAKSLVTRSEYQLNEKISAFRMPVYPFFLASVIKIFGTNDLILNVRIIQSFLNILLISLISLIAYLIFSKRIALGGLLFLTFYQPFVFLSSQLLSDHLSILLVYTSLLLTILLDKIDSKTHAFFCVFFISLTTVLAVLCRANNIVLLFLPVYSVMLVKKRFNIIPFLLIMVLPFMIWGAWIGRNYIEYKQPIFLCTNGGMNLYFGNNPDLNNKGCDLMPLPVIPEEYQKNDYTKDQYLKKIAVNAINNNPCLFIKRIFYKLQCFFDSYLRQAETSKTGMFILGLIIVLSLFSNPYKIYLSLIYIAMFWVGLFHFLDKDLFIFVFNAINFDLKQILLPALLGMLVFLFGGNTVILRKISPVFIYVIFTMILSAIVLPKMRIRFSIDPVFILFISFFITKLYDFNPVNCNQFFKLKKGV